MTRGPGLVQAAAAAAIVLCLSFYALQRRLERGQLTDAPLYQSVALLVRTGHVPYRDFALSYPPAALPAFLVPSYLPWSYATSFAVVMGLCGAGCIASAAAILRALGAGRWRSIYALLAIGLSPLALGALFDTRFDPWPALLAVASLAAVLHGRPRAFGVLAGLAFAAKLWPLALVPVGLAFLWRRGGRRRALEAGIAFLLTAAACFVPFAVLAPGGLGHSVAAQLDRPLQVESLGAAILLAAEHLGWVSLSTTTTFGSQNLVGTIPDAVAAASSALEALAVVAVWVVFARRRRPSGEAVVLASASVVAAVVASGKVLSPQYLIWLVPLLPLVRGSRGILASLLLFGALRLTQTWFPWHYWQLALGHASPWSWDLLARDLVLVALVAVLLAPAGLLQPVLRRARGSGGRRAGSRDARRAAA